MGVQDATSPEPAGPPGATPATGAPTPSSRRGLAPTALVVGVLLAALGIPVGVLWSALAPRAGLVVTAAGVDYANTETKDFITADATLFLLGLAAGALAATAVWLLARHRGLATLLGLVLGAGAGSYVAWRVGVHGPSRSAVLRAAQQLRPPARGDLPLQLHAHPVLLAWPGAAALTWAGWLLRSPRPPRTGTPPVAGGPEPGQLLSSG